MKPPHLPAFEQSSYPAEVRKLNFFSVVLCQRCREFFLGGVRFGVRFSVLRFPGFGCAREISPKFHVKNGVKNRKFHANFTLLGRSADL